MPIKIPKEVLIFTLIVLCVVFLFTLFRCKKKKRFDPNNPPLPPNMFSVPNFIGLSLEDAKEISNRFIIVVNDVKETSDFDKDQIIFEQDPAAGEVVEATKNDPSTVNVSIYKFVEPEVPVGPVEPEVPVGPVEPEVPVGPVEPEVPVGPVEQNTVPNILGLQELQAKAVLILAGYVPVKGEDIDANVSFGSVAKQIPVAGTPLAKNSEVIYNLQNGSITIEPEPPVIPPVAPQLSIVPNIIGKTKEEALSILTNFGYDPSYGGLTFNEPNSVAGRVSKQEPSGGTVLSKNSPVTFFIAGIKLQPLPQPPLPQPASLIQVPNIINMTKDAAISLLQQKGFNPVYDGETFVANITIGNVASQSPLGNTQAFSGSDVLFKIQKIIISPQPPLPMPTMVKVPDLVNLTQIQAQTALSNQGLLGNKMDTIVLLGSPKAGKVISQEQLAGSFVLKGSTINYNVGKVGLTPIPTPTPLPIPIMVKVPNLLDLSQLQAETILANQGLVGNKTDLLVPIGSLKAGKVVSQEQTPGSFILKGSTINYKVGKVSLVPIPKPVPLPIPTDPTIPIVIKPIQPPVLIPIPIPQPPPVEISTNPPSINPAVLPTVPQISKNPMITPAKVIQASASAPVHRLLRGL